MLLGLCALGVVSCNFAAGGVGVAVFGGSAYLLWQCYDHAVIDVRRADTGALTCDAEVTLQREVVVEEGQYAGQFVADGRPSTVRPCYHASLSEGRWKLEAKLPGFEPISSTIVVEPHEGLCPGYTHSVELSLEPSGSSRGRRRLRARQIQTPGEPQPGVAPSQAQPRRAVHSTKAFGLKPAAWKDSPAPQDPVPPPQAPAPAESPNPPVPAVDPERAPAAPAPGPGPQPAPAGPRPSPGGEATKDAPKKQDGAQPSPQPPPLRAAPAPKAE